MKTITKVIIGTGIVGVGVVLYFVLKSKKKLDKEILGDDILGDNILGDEIVESDDKDEVERKLMLHRERQEAERRLQEELQRERDERDEEGVLYLSKGSDNPNEICNESTVNYVSKYKPPFARGVEISNVRVNGNVDSFKIIKATGDAKSFVGKRIVIDDNNKLKSINNCN